MVVYADRIEIKTREMDIVDITQGVHDIVARSGVKEGMANVFCPGSTGAITTIEHEPGLMKDLPAALERLAPRDAYYNHEEMWHDGNGHRGKKQNVICHHYRRVKG